MERNRRPEQTKITKKNVFFVISAARYLTQFGLVWAVFCCEKCDSEHPTPQQQSEENTQISAYTRTNSQHRRCFQGKHVERNRNKKARKKITFFAIPRVKYRTQFGLFLEENSDSEHLKTQQRDRKIGQTIGSPMRISAVQLVLLTKGMEARIRKKQEERSRLWEPLGSLGEPLGKPLGRLGGGFGETQRAFF